MPVVGRLLNVNLGHAGPAPPELAARLCVITFGDAMLVAVMGPELNDDSPPLRYQE
jgi:hypothetical protein